MATRRVLPLAFGNYPFTARGAITGGLASRPTVGAKVAAGADAGVGSAGKVHGPDFLDGVFDGVFQIIDFFGGDIEVFAVESAGFVRLDKVDDGIGDFVTE